MSIPREVYDAAVNPKKGDMLINYPRYGTLLWLTVVGQSMVWYKAASSGATNDNLATLEAWQRIALNNPDKLRPAPRG
jgi:hypothetical protein